MMSLRVAIKATFLLTLLAVATTQGRQENQSPTLTNEKSIGMRLSFNDGHEDILHHLRRILPVYSPAISREIHGYFYAQYFSKANCSSGTGFVSYVEGYAAGLCFQKSDDLSGLPSGSVTQTCSPIGTYCPIISLDREY